MFQLYVTAIEIFRCTIIKCWVMMDCFIVAYCTETKHIKIVNIFRCVRKIAKSDY